MKYARVIINIYVCVCIADEHLMLILWSYVCLKFIQVQQQQKKGRKKEKERMCKQKEK